MLHIPYCQNKQKRHIGCSINTPLSTKIIYVYLIYRTVNMKGLKYEAVAMIISNSIIRYFKYRKSKYDTRLLKCCCEVKLKLLREKI